MEIFIDSKHPKRIINPEANALRHVAFTVESLDNLTDYKVKEIGYSHGTYRLGEHVEIIDEDSFYRIDGIHIFDKHKIEEIRGIDGKVEIHMKDKDVVLIV